MVRVRDPRFGRTPAAAPGTFLGAAIAALYLLAVLTPPEVWLGGGLVPRVSLEAIALVPLLLLVRGTGGRAGRWLLRMAAFALVLLFAFAVADTFLLHVFDRPLDIPLDIHLAPALMEVGADALGMVHGWLWAGALLVSAALIGWFNIVALNVLARVPLGGGVGLLVAAAGLAAVTAQVFAVSGVTAGGCSSGVPLSCRAAQVAGHQVRSAVALWRPMPAFDRALADDALAREHAEAPLLTRLRTSDVLLIFIESYGTSALRDGRYASEMIPKLRRMERDLRDEGFAVASGTLEAPTVGGLSWLSHGTLLSGVWLDNQRLYQRLISSERRTLVHAFAAAGHRTVGIFPQMLRPWPEGGFFGYHQIWTSENIDYSGPRFGWTTMPDQYTLWFLEWKERRATAPRPPIFAEVALISSHAPWEPVPTMIAEWEALGTGEAFTNMVESDWSGPKGWPEEAPRNYTRTIVYSLDAVAGFARRFAGADTLMIVLGDHEPAPLITGGDSDRTVPVHAIAGDPELLQPFVEWGFDPSMLPPLHQGARRMDAFRDWFVDAFSDSAPSRDVARQPD